MTQIQKRQQQEKPGDGHDEELENNSIDHDSQAYGIFFNLIYRGVRRCAATSIGILAIDKVSQVLEIVEKTAKWSLPVQRVSSDDVEEVQLERPLSWIPFLGLILLLRFTQLLLSLAAICIGNDPIQAKDTVTFLQTRRRKLRVLRFNACRAIHKRSKESWRAMFGEFFSKLICRPRLDSSEAILESVINLQRNEMEQTVTRPVLQQSHNTVENAHDDSLSVTQLLEKYAAEDSANDSDYIPFRAEPTETSEISVSSLSGTDDSINSSSSQIQNQDNYLPTSKTNNSRNHSNIKENGGDCDVQLESDKVKKLKNMKQKQISQDICRDINGEIAENRIKQNGVFTDCDGAATVITARPLLVDDCLTPPLRQLKKLLTPSPPPNNQFDCKCHCHSWQWLAIVLDGERNGGGGPGSRTSSVSSNEDIFYSPIDSPKIDKHFEFSPDLVTNFTATTTSTISSATKINDETATTFTLPQQTTSNNNKTDGESPKLTSSNHGGPHKHSSSGKSYNHQGKRGKHRR